MSPRPRTISDEAILAATHDAVVRRGPTHLTLADVARQAGISPATLLQRFGSKRGLLLALARSGVEGLAGEFARIRGASRSPLGAVYGVADCMAAMAVSPEALSNSLAFLQIDLIDPEFHRHALAHSRSMRAALKALLDEACAAGELVRCDTGRLARAVQVMIGGALLQWAVDRDGPAARRLREDLETLLRPLVRRRPRARRKQK